jgi:drug/metabolite transporter (DMT)-like permease
VSKYHLLFLFAVAVAGFGQVALKRAAMEQGRSLLRQYANGYVVLGYFLMFCSMGMISVAYRGVPFKEGPVLESLTFVWVPLLSSFFLGERITKTKALGFLIIIFGVVVFSL